MRRRTILKLFTLPALAALWPRPASAQPSDGPFYTDDRGTVDLRSLYDYDLTTGIEYST